MNTLDLRPSPIAGTWYEGRPEVLKKEIDRYLDEAQLPDLSGEVVALIAPHAGHRYSGPVAGHAFAAVRGRTYDLVVVLSPMHQPYYEPLLTAKHDAYETPLGNVPIDHAALSELDVLLQAELGFGVTAVRNDQEHSLEIELPFLQRSLKGDFRLLPVMVRAQEPQVARKLGEAVAKILKGKNSLLVASTDLSHFYEQEAARLLDAEMLRCMESFEPDSIFEAERTGKGFACGHAATAAVLWAARQLGGKTVKVLNHATSGDVTGDYGRVVGYGAAVVLKPRP